MSRPAEAPGPSSEVGTTVLLLDPDAETRDMYREFLAFHHVRVVDASTVAEALRLMPAADAMVTEIRISGDRDGLEFVRAARASTRSVAIVVLTASPWTENETAAMTAGCDVFLAKPCLPDVLLATIERLLAQDAA